MKLFLLGILTLLLAGCAAHPTFSHEVYSAKETPVPGILLLTLHFPSSVTDEFRAQFLARAAAEECASRKFPFSDSALALDGSARAFCYEKAAGPNLAALFIMKAAASSPTELRVEDTPTAHPSPLLAWDVIRKASARNVHDIAELKEAIFLASQKGAKTISLSIERSEIPLVVQSPIYLDAAGLVTPEKLEELRVKVP